MPAAWAIDAGPAAPRGEALATDAALVALFAAQHSGMARRGFKRLAARALPAALERSAYVAASGAVLWLLTAAWRPLRAPVWTSDAPLARAAIGAAFALGWIVLLAATLAIDPSGLAGLRQARDAARGAPTREPAFRVRGLHRAVRHPTYLGWLLVFWAEPSMTEGRALLASLMTAYVLVAIRFEERDLLRAHGDVYARYRRAVPMLVPWRGVTRFSA